MGQVMQCGPPPARTSSPPSKVIAARSLPAICRLLPRNSVAEIILNPAFSSSLKVVSFRAYEVITPGLLAAKLHPEAPCFLSRTTPREPQQRIGSIGMPQFLK